MAEYIEREQVKDELLSWAVCIKHPEHLLKEDALCVIDAIPSADVVPVKHGWWENLTHNEGWAYCSACHCCWEWGIINDCNVRYCPNCGCKMDLEVTNGLDQH